MKIKMKKKKKNNNLNNRNINNSFFIKKWININKYFKKYNFY